MSKKRPSKQRQAKRSRSSRKIRLTRPQRRTAKRSKSFIPPCGRGTTSRPAAARSSSFNRPDRAGLMTRRASRRLRSCRTRSKLGQPVRTFRAGCYFARENKENSMSSPCKQKRPPERSCPRGAEDNLLIRERLDAQATHFGKRSGSRGDLCIPKRTANIHVGETASWSAERSAAAIRSLCRPIHRGSVDLSTCRAV
jgi:hypothetical protein